MLTRKTMTMNDIFRAVAIFVWGWTTERGRELVTEAPRQAPRLLVAVLVLAAIVSVMYILIKVGVL